MGHPYAGAGYCRKCPDDWTMQATFRHGNEFYCRAHWEQEANKPVPPFRTAEEIEAEYLAGKH